MWLFQRRCFAAPSGLMSAKLEIQGKLIRNGWFAPLEEFRAGTTSTPFEKSKKGACGWEMRGDP
jgi:hypothetical protein